MNKGQIAKFWDKYDLGQIIQTGYMTLDAYSEYIDFDSSNTISMEYHSLNKRLNHEIISAIHLYPDEAVGALINAGIERYGKSKIYRPEIYESILSRNDIKSTNILTLLITCTGQDLCFYDDKIKKEEMVTKISNKLCKFRDDDELLEILKNMYFNDDFATSFEHILANKLLEIFEKTDILTNEVI